VFAKSPEAKQQLQAQFEERTVQRVYTALVKGVISALPLERVLTPKPPPDPELVKLGQLLAR